MEKIKSFTIDHLILVPGIYESRRDNVNGISIITYDLRVTRPNFEPVMNTAEIHTIEHLGATYLRNQIEYSSRIIYFGPMGCRTGFYLLIAGDSNPGSILTLVNKMFEFISDFGETIPGSEAKDCGNYLDHNLQMAKYIALKYLNNLKSSNNPNFEYPG
jgi:S-ribosylhomocysteine lyase